MSILARASRACGRFLPRAAGRNFASEAKPPAFPEPVKPTYPYPYGTAEETVMSPFKGGPVYLWLRASYLWLRRWPGRHWMRWLDRNWDWQKMAMLGVPECHIDPTKNRWRYFVDTSMYNGMMAKVHEDFHRYVLLYPFWGLFIVAAWGRFRCNDKDNFLAKWRVSED
mmetsp:Transcript_59629/g.141894  ORF Transcript_59629/g.141894 Transcript_59629/m.141894 type:complete len:168 (+) Transcript_59629:89-592(+)|eukprot:CAMPEP_0178402268 /NCGR_PEP_ID=MMETSP0689_2-20121128/16747_1 /TAXON_ID=160604 /ORGANISM="Amphidinium massartii, Strain CS-259" /LENGTH=167 /DNA_ID=CAMNT_0020023149 /DNA_START=88 /DNA_END=591 /DNA_ORIENTATION=+